MNEPVLKSTLFFIKIFFFWLLLFFAERLVFLVINLDSLAALRTAEVLLTFYQAIPLDLSMAGYIALFPFLVLSFFLLSGKKEISLKWLRIYHGVLVTVFAIIAVVNFNIYREWGSKINAKAIEFAFHTPNEALASSASSPIFLSLLVLAALLVTGLLLSRLLFPGGMAFAHRPVWIRLSYVLILGFFLFVIIRGGLRGSPMKQSMAYFSEHQLLNHAAVNTDWNLMYSLMASGSINKNPYIFFEEQTAKRYVSELYRTRVDSTEFFLSKKDVNVVLVIMESFGADLTKTLGNEDGIAPHFDSLINDGVLFSNIYASGSRTDKGLMATLAGFPTLAAASIMKWPEKIQKLPSISQALHGKGYHTSFFYGGESEFDNYKAFVLSHAYDHLIDKNDFEKAGKSPWGQFDEAVFSKQVQHLNKEKLPFFSTVLTLTNHEPYVLPGRYRFGDEDNKAKFKSTAYYTDSCINAFLEDAKKQSWYTNTLFVFMADHAHIYPKDRHDIATRERYHIPLLFYGDVIAETYRGKRFDKTGSQTDLAATLLAQLGIPSQQFKWSKDLTNPGTTASAFFSWDNGMGLIYGNEYVSFDCIGNQLLNTSKDMKPNTTEEILRYNKAYLQTVYHDFLEL